MVPPTGTSSPPSSTPVTPTPTPQANKEKGSALVFGASGVQGHAVIEGMKEKGYSPVYGVTRSTKDPYLTDVLGATLIPGGVSNAKEVEKILLETKARHIFVVTTTDMPTGIGQTSGFWDAQQEEYQVIVDFFETLFKVYEQDGIERHVVLSTLDNVEEICNQIRETTGKEWIPTLDDGSIVAHYSGKGKAGQVATQMLEPIDGLHLTLLTLPFLHGNFLGFFTPLPNDGATQWSISACFGDDSQIDMMSESDLAYIVPSIFQKGYLYDGKNIRCAAEQISMEEVAAMFSDLFGKDVIYNPLSPEEMATLPIPAAGCMAQMCQFLSNPKCLQHDVEQTEMVMYPRKPQPFKDWLLVNSDSEAFERVGLSIDAPDILEVTVFGATGMQGTSVVKGLLADTRKSYKIRATTRHPDSPKAKAIAALDPARITIAKADYDDIQSCHDAVKGVDGAFLVTDFHGGAQMNAETEERHAKNVIDACEASHTVKHLVFSTMENVEEMNAKFNLGLKKNGPSAAKADGDYKSSPLPQFDAKARAAAYARTKRISVTYVLMPCYSEMFFELLKPERRVDPTTGKEKLIMTVPLKDDTKVMCMSVEDLGPAVANIFDSYQCYAGHEIGLVTEFVTVKEAAEIIQDVFRKDENEEIQDDDELDNNEVHESKKSRLTTTNNIDHNEIHLEEDVRKVDQWLEAKDTYMKDLGQMFKYMAHTDAVKERRSVAKTLKLLPNARSLRNWVEQNKDNVSFREKLGLR